MLKKLKQLVNGERGQALAIVLGLLAIGGLTVAGTVNYATTSLKSNQIIQENTRGIYAAGAGVEYSLWALLGNGTPLTQLPENVNQMQVNINIVEEDEALYTLYLDELVEIDSMVHSDWVVVSTNITLVGGTTSNYTISIIRLEEADGTIKLKELGAVLPMGYTYVPDSAALFPENISPDNPTDTGNLASGAQWLKWIWAPGIGRPLITGNHTQGFYIDGTGSLDGAYAWLVAQSNDIGEVSEILGVMFRITSTAVRPEDGRTMAKINCDVIIGSGKTYILSWRISK
ncbi:hypothetical protein ACFLVC_01550 [Chloroflexota bacterium]